MFCAFCLCADKLFCVFCLCADMFSVLFCAFCLCADKFSVLFCVFCLCADTLFTFSAYDVQMMRKCINNQSNPVVEGQIGKPPFEKPSIAKVGDNKDEEGVTNIR